MSPSAYFPGDDQKLADLLDSYLGWLAEEARSLTGLRALVLAGGYGRGEGGIFEDGEGGSALYNDAEFYLFADKVRPDLISRWVHEGEERLGIEVEFKVMSPSSLARARPSMFFYDLLGRHVLVAGERHWTATLPEALSSSDALPWDEGSRLLINRGVSLMRCLRWARGGGALPEGFSARITGKLQLAMADAVLCASGLYHWSCRERNQRLPLVTDTPPDWERIVAWHAEGVRFKLHPHLRDGDPVEALPVLDELRRVWLSTFLWIESRRMGEAFQTPGDYGRFRGRLFPHERRSSNLLRQMRDFNRSERLPFAWGEHPRAAIWRSVVLLLGQEPGAEQAAARLLGAPGKTGVALEEYCRACWRHYP